MNALEGIRQKVHNALLDLRAIDRLVNSDEFAIKYNQCTESERQAADHLIMAGQKEQLDVWMKTYRGELNYAELSVRELRQLGQQLGIRSYNRLPKALLLSEIENAKRSCQGPAQIDEEDYSQFAGSGYS